MNFFKYNDSTKTIELDESTMFLISEFNKLLDADRNKCKLDKTGNKKLRAYREFQYMFLCLDWKSPYASDLEQERHEKALADSSLTDNEFNDVDFRAACRKYKEVQESVVSIKLLNSIRTAAHKIINYYNTVRIGEEGEDGKLLVKTKDVIDEISKSGPLLESIKKLEDQVRKDLELNPSKLRGQMESGAFDD
jgi:hypothetical protein